MTGKEAKEILKPIVLDKPYILIIKTSEEPEVITSLCNEQELLKAFIDLAHSIVTCEIIKKNKDAEIYSKIE